MARQEVMQVRCDRCKRVELVPKAPPKERPDFDGRFFDNKLVYEDLCAKCKSTIANHWKDIEEWERELTQKMLGDPEAAPPLEIKPDHTPPKPHSAAAVTKR